MARVGGVAYITLGLVLVACAGFTVYESVHGVTGTPTWGEVLATSEHTFRGYKGYLTRHQVLEVRAVGGGGVHVVHVKDGHFVRGERLELVRDGDGNFELRASAVNNFGWSCAMLLAALSVLAWSVRNAAKTWRAAPAEREGWRR